MRRILLVLMMICAAQFCFAETIRLKSGKVITGKIVERNDKSVKVEIEGVPITYYSDAIESIDEKGAPAKSESKPQDSAKAEKIYYTNKQTGNEGSSSQAGGESSKPKNWEGWITSVAGYLSQVQIISTELRQIGEDAKQKMLPLDQKSKLPVLDEVITKTEAVKKRADNLSPPAELRAYHEKFLNSVDIYLALAKSLRASPDESQLGFFKQLEKNALEMMEEARRVYVQQGIPPEFLSQVDAEISRGKAALAALGQRVQSVEENRSK